MTSLIVILAAIALIDSTSMIPIGLLPMAAILGGVRPIVGAMSFILGIFLVYFLSGVVLLFGFGLVIEVIGPTVSRWWYQPNTAELLLQLFVGIAVLFYAWKLHRKPGMDASSGSVEPVSPTRAFTLGASLTAIGVPGAIPYLGAVEQVLRAELHIVASIGVLVVYNVVFVAPFFALLLVRVLVPDRSEAVFGSISELIARWGKAVMVTCLFLLGLVLAADSIGWFLGHPVLPVD